jgi:fimbrial chaperone protein
MLMMMRFARTMVAAAVAVLIAPLCASAADFEVAPLSVHIRPGASSQTITIINTSAEPLRIQVSGMAWQQSADGKEHLLPTDELVFFPTLLDIAPNATRAIRVGIANPSLGSTERTYRLFVLELPSLASQFAPQTAAVSLRMQMGIPVFLDPLKPAAKPELAVTAKAHGTLEVHVRNDGNAHFQARTIDIDGRDAHGVRVFTQRLDGWYVLANRERVYDVAVDPAACATMRDVHVTATTDAGTVTRTFAIGGVSCR